jgi:predicted nuclease of restriction endonuclease-like RecB superfamily
MNGYAKPKFIDVEDPNLLDTASQLIALYDPETGMLRSEIDEIVLPLLKSHKDLKLAKGLNKLILDRCEFSVPSELDYQTERRAIFVRSAELIRNGNYPDYEDFADKIKNSSNAQFIENGIYSDLPENETLTSVKQLYPRELLERYNCSLVQSLLFYSRQMEVTLEDPEPSKMRKMLKYLKFFRLLAEIKTDAKSTPGEEMPVKISMKIDGPASLFENTQKYGLQLACFFPAICDLDKWKLKTDLIIDKKELRLSLDQKSGLVSHYRNFSAYVPEEIAMFHKLFKEKSQIWQITGHSSFMNLGNQELIFPDLTFQNKEGKTIHLELFHRWHSTPLMQRLKTCKQSKDIPLIIGVDRSLHGKPEIKNALEKSDYFASSGFLFRDFPGVDKTLKKLEEKASMSNAEQLDLGF